MKIPYKLSKTLVPAPAEALFLSGNDTRRLLTLASRVEGGFPETLYRISGGTLIVLPRPTTASFPGTIRLRRLAERLFVPVDAELIPALFDEEARGLTRTQGLLFLPGGQLRAFDPGKPLRPNDLLRPARIDRPLCRAFPQLPKPSTRIVSILFEPPTDLDSLFDSGNRGVATEVHEPAPGPGTEISGSLRMSFGQVLRRLGQLLGSPALTRLGARWMADAAAQIPRLTTALVGHQEALLRRLLREFQEGDVDKALERALPLDPQSPGRGPSPGAGVSLPAHDLGNDLGGLLEPSSERGSTWLTRPDVYEALRQEYHKAAVAALAAGNMRRAAFIFGKLLGDYSAAAGILLKGGLAREAAIIYLKKAGDPLAAARAFESAGQIDEAVRIYRSRKEYVKLAQMLRRHGDERGALEAYAEAAEQLAGDGHFLTAGALMRDEACSPERALAFFERGWARRPALGASACALDLASHCAKSGDLDRLKRLVDEADDHFLSGKEEIGLVAFYNHLAFVAAEPQLSSLSADFRDRARMALAQLLRRRAREQQLGIASVSKIFTNVGIWPEAMMSDAGSACGKAPLEPVTPVRSALSGASGMGLVTAVCAASSNGDLVLGFSTGAVTVLHPASFHLAIFPSRPLPVLGLATDEGARIVIVLRQLDPGNACLDSYERQGSVFAHCHSRTLRLAQGAWLITRLVRAGAEWQVAVWHGDCLEVFHGLQLIPAGPLIHCPGARCGLFVPWNERAVGMLTWERGAVVYRQGDRLSKLTLDWTPVVPRGCPLVAPPLVWYWCSKEELEVAGLGENGELFWSRLRLEDHTLSLSKTCLCQPRNYRALAFLGPGRLAAVAEGHVYWLRTEGRTFATNSTTTPMTEPVACFVSIEDGQLVLIDAEGTMAGVTLPGK